MEKRVAIGLVCEFIQNNIRGNSPVRILSNIGLQKLKTLKVSRKISLNRQIDPNRRVFNVNVHYLVNKLPGYA